MLVKRLQFVLDKADNRACGRIFDSVISERHEERNWSVRVRCEVVHEDG